ncbi:MAG: adenylate/guanylate cyclase domain-containing protein [Paracoccaceae bacterium]|nr:MAG: adenylate/guanylate cyclase domain-containing protein [Paracoccaceae bacterium]
MPEPHPPEERAGWNSSLRVLLATTTVALILVVSTALVSLGFMRARDVAIADAETSMRVFSARLVARFEGAAEPTVAALGLITSVPNAFLSPPPARTADKSRMLRGIMDRAPYLEGVYAGYPDGSFFHVVNLRGQGWRAALAAPEAATFAIRSIQVTGGAPVESVTFHDASGATIGRTGPAEVDFDPRTRPWYQAAATVESAVTTGPYRMATTDRIGMTVARRHSAGTGVVIGADIILDTIVDFLSAERLTPGTVAFIVNRDGLPLIHSNSDLTARLLAQAETGGAPRASGDPILDAFATLDNATDTARLVRAGGQQFVVMAAPMGTRAMLAGHRIVVAAPLRELTAEARRAAAVGLLVAAAVVLAAVMVALLVSRLITQSLDRLTGGAERLRTLDFVTPIDVQSRIREIGTLGRAMNGARDAINSFALYVPREFVRKGLETGHFTGREAARQEVTALFTDIYDFTTISEAHPPEQVVAMLSDYFDILDEAVKAHHGSIIQFLGDSIFAMWNAPVPDPDHAENACRAALLAQERLAAFNAAQSARGLPAFRTRFGIHCGLAVVGSVGARERLQYTAMGDTINVASRLEGMNKTYGTTILASSTVVERCGGRIAFRPLGTAMAKGRQVSLDIHEVTGAAPPPQTPPGGDPQ